MLILRLSLLIQVVCLSIMHCQALFRVVLCGGIGVVEAIMLSLV